MHLFDEILSRTHFTEKSSDICNIYGIGFGDTKFIIDKKDKHAYTQNQWNDLLDRFNEDWYEYSDWKKELCEDLKGSWANSKLNGFGNTIDIDQMVSRLEPTSIYVTLSPGIINIHCIIYLGESFENLEINVGFKYEYDVQNDIFRLVSDNDKNPSWYIPYRR